MTRDGTAITADLPFLVVLIALVLLRAAMRRSGRFKTKNRLWHENRGLNRIAWFAALLSPVYIILFLTVLWALWQIVTSFPEPVDGNSTDLRWHVLALVGLMTALAGLVGTPLALIRVFTTERQTRTAEEGYITQQINEAVANLAAQKEVNKLGRNFIWIHDGQKKRGFQWYGENFEFPDDEAEAELPKDQTEGDWKNVALTEPNIEVRIGAILALERLARQRSEIAVREKDPAKTANRTPDGILDHDAARDHTRIMEILCAYVRQNAPADGARPLHLTAWDDHAEDFETGEDLGEKYREVLTQEIDSWKRDHPGPGSDVQTALRVLGRRTTAQRGCEGTETLEREILRGAKIMRPRWHGYRLDLRQTDLQLTDLANSADRPMTLAHARLEGARMQGANLRRAEMQGADLRQAEMRGADLWRAEMQGADLWRAEMQGADLRRAVFDTTTDLNAATLRGAALRSVTLWADRIKPDLLTECFGDASVRFEGDWGDGYVPGDPNGKLPLWAQKELNDEEFVEGWRAFQAELDKQSKDTE